ncbi:hypothetical protein HAX54_015894 [Datura stramonium]|uniref:Uncharacterized protein n=1 Tax=Datura stramonium TaxID=4076 RepID=A0ABS8RZH1_DATST|nr:hypothetical protein [Datura stramonium]
MISVLIDLLELWAGYIGIRLMDLVVAKFDGCDDPCDIVKDFILSLNFDMSVDRPIYELATHCDSWIVEVDSQLGSTITYKAMTIFGKIELVAWEDMQGRDDFRHGHTRNYRCLCDLVVAEVIEVPTDGSGKPVGWTLSGIGGHRNNEEEEHHTKISDMDKLILEHMEVTREKFTKQRKALERMSAKFTEMKAGDETCNDLNVMVLANTQEEPQVEEISEFLEQAQQIELHGSLHDGLTYMDNQFMQGRIE